jgi:hypothetical protein
MYHVVWEAMTELQLRGRGTRCTDANPQLTTPTQFHAPTPRREGREHDEP